MLKRTNYPESNGTQIQRRGLHKSLRDLYRPRPNISILLFFTYGGSISAYDTDISYIIT